MYEVDTIVWVPTDLVFTCPGCAEDIVVDSAIRITGAEVVQTSDGRKSGPAEFGANLDSEVLGMRIQHDCTNFRARDIIRYGQNFQRRIVRREDDE